MNHIVKEYLRKFIMLFFDDILVFSKSMEEHLVHLKLTFELLVKHNLFAREAKCSFGSSMIEYLVHFTLLIELLLILQRLPMFKIGLFQPLLSS